MARFVFFGLPDTKHSNESFDSIDNSTAGEVRAPCFIDAPFRLTRARRTRKIKYRRPDAGCVLCRVNTRKCTGKSPVGQNAETAQSAAESDANLERNARVGASAYQLKRETSKRSFRELAPGDTDISLNELVRWVNELSCLIGSHPEKSFFETISVIFV